MCKILNLEDPYHNQEEKTYLPVPDRYAKFEFIAWSMIHQWAKPSTRANTLNEEFYTCACENICFWVWVFQQSSLLSFFILQNLFTFHRKNITRTVRDRHLSETDTDTFLDKKFNIEIWILSVTICIHKKTIGTFLNKSIEFAREIFQDTECLLIEDFLILYLFLKIFWSICMVKITKYSVLRVN